MKIEFFKYQGAGNDFIVIDHRVKPVENMDCGLVAKLCDRRFGIGADGLMFLTKHPKYDFEMCYYNADGREGSMCGNGGRCIVAFARDLGIIKDETTFLAVDGPHYAKISEDWVSLQMIDVTEINLDQDAFVLDTGSPHYVKFTSQLEDKDVFNDGKAIRNNAVYKKNGINVNFVEEKENHLFVRTFERGVEDETFACGTGVTAVALANAKKNNLRGEIKTRIKVLGGDLSVRFNYDGKVFTDIFLDGPALVVFKGELNV